MKIFPKLLVTICATFTLGCLAGGSTSKESVSKENDAEERKETKTATAYLEKLKGLYGDDVRLQCSLRSDDPRGTIIEVSASEIQALKKQFDDRLITPAHWGSQKFVRFPYKHIFNASNKKRGHVGHYDPQGTFSPAQKAASTSFPSDWSKTKIMSKIMEAYANWFKRYYDDQVKNWVVLGQTSEGIKIKIRFETDRKGYPTGKVKTAYPVS